MRILFLPTAIAFLAVGSWVATLPVAKQQAARSIKTPLLTVSATTERAKRQVREFQHYEKANADKLRVEVVKMAYLMTPT
ncbi:hypothetical protein V1283_002682 [Bradyrhizobium sp. AZCC 2262]